LFDGYKDLGWVAVSDSTLAFKQDIRAKYDVLVFYDSLVTSTRRVKRTCATLSKVEKASSSCITAF